MRFVKLLVESFQAVQHASVDFGPGLNILYGPNDLGKSTLARAIRAALLVPPTSAEGGSYAAWYADATPRVELTFVDDSGHYWRVKKGFGGSTGSSAELGHSKDGMVFALDGRGRQVEEKLRTLLAWGVPTPGGKGAPRGLPDSFLANVLLAAQTDVDAILGRSLDADLEPSGKLRLTRALATLAQDPLFKKVLDAAQHEVDQCFTPTRQRKRGQGSKFTTAANAVKQHQAELTALQRQRDESSAIERQTREIRERRDGIEVRVDDAKAVLSAVRQQLQRAQARDEARARVETARIALGKIEERAAEVEALRVEMAAAGAHAKAQEEAVRRAVTACADAEAALRAAEEAHRAASNDDGAHERELRRARLAEKASSLLAAKQAAEARKGKAEAARTARAAALAARRAVVDARAEHGRLGGALASLRERTAKVEAALALSGSLIAYGRWHAAVTAAEDAKRKTLTAAKNRFDADQKEAEATAIDERVRAIEEELSTRQAILPTVEQAATLAQLEIDLRLAEAALGGGISVAVRPRHGVAVRALLDGAIIDEPDLSAERVFDAERGMRLSIGDIVEVEVTAGAAEKRQAVDARRTRWRNEAVPILERAGAKSPRDVERALGELATGREKALELQRAAQRLRVEAKGLREQAAIQEEHASKHEPSVLDVDARRAAIGSAELGSLEAEFAKLGRAWEAQANARHDAHSIEIGTLRKQFAEQERRLVATACRVEEAERRVVELDAASDAAIATLESLDPETLLQTLDAELASLSREEAENAGHQRALQSEASSRIEEAAKAVETAQGGVRFATEARQLAEASQDQARADLNSLIGKHGASKGHLDAMDLAGAKALVEQRELELAALPDGGSVTAAAVEVAERELALVEKELADTNEELLKNEGALSKVGGAALTEKVAWAEDALRVARDRERALEVEAEAWKLLAETLRAVENEEGAHLGRALATPLTTKFMELTGGRYKGLRLDATLKTERVESTTPVAQDVDVLEALSVGTRNQLATLIRLTIADYLKSAIVLDDHLVHTDPTRLTWFCDVLRKTAPSTQVIVFTCRPEDYVAREDLPAGTATRDLAGGAVRVIDGVRVMRRWATVPSLPFYPVETRPVVKSVLTIVDNVEEAEQFRDALPVYDLAAAAGGFSASQAPTTIGWAHVKSRHPLGREMFVARIVGKSMEPGVPDGAWVIFRAFPDRGGPPPTAHDGRRVLVQLRDDADPETGGRYTFKRWRNARFSPEGDLEEVELRADNPSYPTRRFTARDGDLQVVAEFVETVG